MHYYSDFVWANDTARPDVIFSPAGVPYLVICQLYKDEQGTCRDPEGLGNRAMVRLIPLNESEEYPSMGG